MLPFTGLVVLLSIVPLAATAASPPGAAAAPSAPSPPSPAPSTIQVVARATVAVKPDQAELTLGVTTDAKTATAAVAENQKSMEKVIAVLKKEIGAAGEVKTSRLNVIPRFDEPRPGQGSPRVVGYTVANLVEARTPNIAAAGRLLDLAFQAGANTVERVAFTLKDPEPAQNQALRAASAKARARATAIADGQGLRVGDVILMSEGERAFSPMESVSYDRGSFGLRSTPVEPGSVEVAATVTVVFALRGR